MLRDRNSPDDEFEADRPAQPRHPDDFDDDPAYSRSPLPRPKGVNVCGVIALVLGIIGLVIALIPCVGIVGIPIAAIGFLLGVIGIFTSGRTTGRGLPIAGTCVSVAGLVIAGIWLALTASVIKKSGEQIEAARVEMEAQAKIIQEESRVAQEQRQQEDKELREGQATAATADKLYEEFDKNPLTAESTYKGKVLEVTGTLLRVERDRFGRSTLVFEAGKNANAAVRCDFSRDANAQLEKLEVKQKVTVRGKYAGKGKNQAVRLENCLLVSK